MTMSVMGAMLVGLAVIAFVAALVVRTSPSAAGKRLQTYSSPVQAQIEPGTSGTPGFIARVLAPSLEGLGRRLARFSPKGYTSSVEQLLALLGPPYRLQLGGFLGIQFVLSLLLLVPILWWSLRTYPNTPAQWVLGGLLAVVMGIYFPYFWLARRVTRRKNALLRALPGALDFLAIALSELGNISERRTYLLISGQRDLSPFLVANAGLNSGFMIPQYTAASIVSQNKQLCTPASVDSIVSSNGQEDHVSMGANAATKAFRVVENLKNILAIELFTACQTLEFRRPSKSSKHLESIFEKFRSEVSFVNEDRLLADDIRKAKVFLENNEPGI